MNNNQELVQDKPLSIPPMNEKGENDNLNSDANSANNSLNTFQDIKKAEYEKDDNSLSDDGIANAIADATKGNSSANDTDSDKNATSDKRAKELFGDRGLDIVDCISKLNAYVYKYKPGVDKVDKHATPDKEHVGIIAQELQKNPVTKTAVVEDPLSGFLQVDTKELSTTMMAILTAMAKKIKELEAKLS